MADKNQDPMSLENLPEYLKALRKSGNMGGAPVVNTGQIVTTNSSMGWLQASLFAAVICMVLGVGGMMTYTMMSPRNITVIVDIDNASPQTIEKIVNDSGGEVLSVDQKDDNTFEVKVKTRKSKKSFLDFLRGNEDIKNAELEN